MEATASQTTGGRLRDLDLSAYLGIAVFQNRLRKLFSQNSPFGKEDPDVATQLCHFLGQAI